MSGISNISTLNTLTRCVQWIQELHKHLQTIPRFGPLLKRLDVAAKVAALQRQPSSALPTQVQQTPLAASSLPAPAKSQSPSVAKAPAAARAQIAEAPASARLEATGVSVASETGVSVASETGKTAHLAGSGCEDRDMTLDGMTLCHITLHLASGASSTYLPPSLPYSKHLVVGAVPLRRIGWTTGMETGLKQSGGAGRLGTSHESGSWMKYRVSPCCLSQSLSNTVALSAQEQGTDKSRTLALGTTLAPSAHIESHAQDATACLQAHASGTHPHVHPHRVRTHTTSPQQKGGAGEGRTFLQSFSVGNYEDKTVLLDEAVTAHKQELLVVHSELADEKLAMHRLFEAYHQKRQENEELVAHVSKLQHHLALAQGLEMTLSPYHSTKPGDGGSSPTKVPLSTCAQRKGTRVGREKAGRATWSRAEGKQLSAFGLRLVFAALDKQRSMVLRYLPLQLQRSLLTDNCTLIKKRKNDVLCKQGDVATSVYLVLDGELEMWVSHVRGAHGGQETGHVSKMLTRRIQTLEAGDSIGDVDAVLQATYMASIIVSSTSCSLAQVPQTALRAVLHQRPDVIQKMTRHALLEAPIFNPVLFTATDREPRLPAEGAREGELGTGVFPF